MAGQYFGSVPGIQKAYENDPRTRLAANALATGTSVAPVAGGGWGVTDGLARAAQAVLGAVVQKKQDKKYAQREQDYAAQLGQAAQLASQPQPSPMGAAAAALGGGPAPVQAPMQPSSMAIPAPIRTIDPNIAMGAGQGAPPAQGVARMAPQQPSPGRRLPPPLIPRPVEGGVGPSTGALGVTFGGGSLPDSIQTVGQLVANKRQIVRAYGASPVGVYQINAGTWADFAPRVLGKNWREAPIRDFATQDAVAKAIYDSTGGDPKKLMGRWSSLNLNEAQSIAGKPWEAARDVISQGESTTSATKFANDVAGNTQPAPGGQTPITAGIVAPQMEAVPDLPQAPTEAPAAPTRPGEVQTNRIPIAQQLMATGNPDLMAYAQEMLGTGLTEQNAARTLGSQQEFTQGQTGYQSSLNDFNDARSQARGAVIGDRTATAARNFSREQTFGDQTFRAGQAQVGREYETGAREDTQAFQAGESAADRALRISEADKARQYGTSERIAGQEFQSNETQKERDNRLAIANSRGQKRNDYFNSPSGRKMQADNDKEAGSNSAAIGKYERFIALNQRNGTGGFVQNAMGAAGVYRMTDAEKAEMYSIADDTTLASLGGSLGTAISDGDRKFISGSNVNLGIPRSANENIARARIGALRRRNDYLAEFTNAQADGTQAEFAKNWQKFANSAPIVIYGKDGKTAKGANDQPMTYAEWLNSRPKFDKNGRPVK